MKLKLVRMSGLPVSEENLAAYNEEFKAAYDIILAENGNDMLVVHQKLQELDANLQQKFQRIETSEVPKSAKGWHKLLEAYETPIMLAKSSENPKELVLVIMDEPLA